MTFPIGSPLNEAESKSLKIIRDLYAKPSFEDHGILPDRLLRVPSTGEGMVSSSTVDLFTEEIFRQEHVFSRFSANYRKEMEDYFRNKRIPAAGITLSTSFSGKFPLDQRLHAISQASTIREIPMVHELLKLVTPSPDPKETSHPLIKQAFQIYLAAIDSLRKLFQDRSSPDMRLVVIYLLFNEVSLHYSNRRLWDALLDSAIGMFPQNLPEIHFILVGQIKFCLEAAKAEMATYAIDGVPIMVYHAFRLMNLWILAESSVGS